MTGPDATPDRVDATMRADIVPPLQGVASWYPPAPAPIHSEPVGWPIEVRSPLPPRAAERRSMVTRSLRLASGRPKVLSLALRRAPLETISVVFPLPVDSPSGSDWLAPAVPPGGALASSTIGAGRSAAAAAAVGRTRMRPPSDLVKLEDRLYYLLQPPLETWLASAALEMPFPPFHYQLEGVAFLYPRAAAILADEMGLGKTMQTITAVRLLLRAGELRRVLLVCPKPLVANWQREFALWAPEIPLTVIEGDQSRRQWQWRLEAPLKIANYELLARDRAALEDPRLSFDLVVLDESQRIKNQGSTTAQVACSIKRRRSWALTGTPVENTAEDLVGIFEFLEPGYLSAEMKLGRMARLARDYVLRRTKDQVLTDLPPKLYRDAELELLPEQQESYRLAEQRGILRLTQLGDAAQIAHVFELVLRLKQICNFDPATGHSAKLERLAADLEEVVASGQKALVFSQWVDTLERLGQRLRRFRPLAFHGRVPTQRREAVISQFREDPHAHVLLISYGAGGVGLNLQFTSYVFLFDRWWNPAVEDQAINRAHRIGATGPVTVSRFLTRDTIEQRIQEVLVQKREIFDTLFSAQGRPRDLGLSRQELFGLFQLRTPQGPIQPAA